MALAVFDANSNSKLSIGGTLVVVAVVVLSFDALALVTMIPGSDGADGG